MKKTDMSAEELLEKYSNMVYRLAYSYVRNHADAEDVFQDTFLRLVRKQPAFESEEHLQSMAAACDSELCEKSPTFRMETPYTAAGGTDSSQYACGRNPS